MAGKCKLTTWEVNNLAKDDVIEIEGIVTDNLPNAMFNVDIGNGHKILATISGKLRMNFIKILPGDKVSQRQTEPHPTGASSLAFFASRNGQWLLTELS